MTFSFTCRDSCYRPTWAPPPPDTFTRSSSSSNGSLLVKPPVVLGTSLFLESLAVEGDVRCGEILLGVWGKENHSKYRFTNFHFLRLFQSIQNVLEGLDLS